MPCRRCKSTETDKNYCAVCAKFFVDTIGNKGEALRAAAVKFARIGETNYLARHVVYSDQANNSSNANHGSAFGFRAESKVFTLLHPGTGSAAIEKFVSPIDSTQTVCECKTFMLAVYYNAIRTVLEDLHPDLFDCVFTKLTLSPDPGDDNTILRQYFEIKAIGFDQEMLVRPGDWLYIANPAADYTEVHVAPTGGTAQSGAAGGWNLVCVEASPNKYLGLGLTKLGSPAPKEQSLVAILEFMNDESKAREVVTKPDAGVKTRARSGSMDLTDKRAEQSRLVLLAEKKKKPRLYQISAKKLAEFVARAL
jgi:hypothetical protein